VVFGTGGLFVTAARFPPIVPPLARRTHAPLPPVRSHRRADAPARPDREGPARLEGGPPPRHRGRDHTWLWDGRRKLVE